MKPATRAVHDSEMKFFRNALEFYNASLDECGSIRKSLSLLKKQLDRPGKKMPPAKWDRLYGALMSGEITRGKKSTPGDWAAQEVKLYKAALP